MTPIKTVSYASVIVIEYRIWDLIIGADDVSTSPTNKPSSDSRWNEIRAANARNTGRQSSWDVLRQSHERSQIQQTNDEPISAESERAQEQARFDAMLEAERRGSQM